jgi:hypothetical protein
MLPKPEHEYGYTRKQILQICKDRKIHHKKFWSAFGVNTCAVDEKLGTIYYPCDVERALYNLGQKDGVNHLWD